MSLTIPFLRLNRSRLIHIPRLNHHLTRPQLRPLHCASPARLARAPHLPKPTHPVERHSYDLDPDPEAETNFVELLSMTGGQLPAPLRVIKLNEAVVVAGSGSKGGKSEYECTR